MLALRLLLAEEKLGLDFHLDEGLDHLVFDVGVDVFEEVFQGQTLALLLEDLDHALGVV